jgi:2-methylisocitrate lyase-like PEP mutase family enzyme
MANQAEKSDVFRALHARDHAFVIPNPWDLGSARMLEGLGFEALATTSAGYAFTLGKRDGAVGRDGMMDHVASLSAATKLPLSVDLENGFGDAPAFVAETIRMVSEAGSVGGSIEDATGKENDPIYEIGFATERIRAAAEAAHATPFAFTLTARCENYLYGKPDLKDTIRRLQAYQGAGADVLYAPGMTKHDEIATLVRSLDRPVNVLVGFKGIRLSVAEASALGVRRLSTGSALGRAAYGAFLAAAEEIRDHGTFGFGDDVPGFSELNKRFF